MLVPEFPVDCGPKLESENNITSLPTTIFYTMNISGLALHHTICSKVNLQFTIAFPKKVCHTISSSKLLCDLSKFRALVSFSKSRGKGQDIFDLKVFTLL